MTGVEVEDSVDGVLPRSRYDFNALGEVYLFDFDEDEEFEVVRATTLLYSPPIGGSVLDVRNNLQRRRSR